MASEFLHRQKPSSGNSTPGEELPSKAYKLGLTGPITGCWRSSALPTGNRGRRPSSSCATSPRRRKRKTTASSPSKPQLFRIFSLDVRSRHGHAAVLQQRAGAPRQEPVCRVRQAAPSTAWPQNPWRARFLTPPFRGTGLLWRPECEPQAFVGKRPLPLDRGLGAACPPATEGHALILLRDVTKKKEEKQLLLALQTTMRKFARLDLEAEHRSLYYSCRQVTISPT